jgi:hypothetical protein
MNRGDAMAAVLLDARRMQERPVTELPRVSERDLEEVLLSLEAELYGPPKKREREDSTVVHTLPPRD